VAVREGKGSIGKGVADYGNQNRPTLLRPGGCATRSTTRDQTESGIRRSSSQIPKAAQLLGVKIGPRTVLLDTAPPPHCSDASEKSGNRKLIGSDLQISFFAALRSACSKASTKGSSSSSLMPILCPVVRQLSTECATALNISLARTFVMRK
jgi:hypothetical protein